MIFAVFDVSLIACRHQQVYKLMFCTFIVISFVVEHVMYINLKRQNFLTGLSAGPSDVGFYVGQMPLLMHFCNVHINA